MKTRDDIIIERVLNGKCPVCNESTEGWHSKNLKAEYTQVNYKGMSVSIHKKHLQGAK